MSDARRAARAFGLRAETLATFWLRAQLFTILDRNYRVQGGEIDIVAQRGHLIVFVEVKARWVATHPWALQRTLRADAILIAPGRWPHWIVSAFEIARL